MTKLGRPPHTHFRALVLRFFTGAAMALVYPMMGKVVSTWFVQGRGFAMGGVLGAVTVGLFVLGRRRGLRL